MLSIMFNARNAESNLPEIQGMLVKTAKILTDIMVGYKLQ